MTINLPDDLKQFIQAEVDRGHFASEEAALAEAVRLLRREGSQTVPPEGVDLIHFWVHFGMRPTRWMRLLRKQ